MAKWIIFEFVDFSITGKTKIWNVISIEQNLVLGKISWFGKWRKYAFFPISNTVFEKQCLRDIADFCELQTKNKKSKRKLN